MVAKINIPPFLKNLSHGVTSVDADGSTVGECLNDLIRVFPSFKERLLDRDGKLVRSVEIYVNRESTYPEELSKPVKDGDELHLVLVLAGG